jgi:hypothetical protein
LSVEFTAVGTLEVWCVSEATGHRWRLQFQIRQADTGVEEGGPPEEPARPEAVIAGEVVAAAAQRVRSLFEGTPAEITPDNIVAHLEGLLGYGKSAWPLEAIRILADAALDAADGRRRSAALEARWLNLFGFCLRPGFGAAKDPWRMGEARKVYAAGLTFPNSVQNRVEWLVLWQRVCGGLSTGQQREIAQRVMGELGLGAQKPKKQNPQIERESLRLLASLERLDPAVRVKVGHEVLRRLRRDPADSSLAWAIGRLGARTPAYGPLTSVVPAEDAVRWLEQLISIRRATPDLAAAIVQLSALSGDPLRDVDERTRESVRERLLAADADPEALRPLDEVIPPSYAQTTQAFGEPLPQGLRLDEAFAAREAVPQGSEGSRRG